MKVKVKDRKSGSYSDETFAHIMTQLLIADKNNVLSYDEIRNIRKTIDDAVIICLKDAIEKEMSYGATFEKNSRQNGKWIECTFYDNNITLDISIDTDRNGNYYLLSYDNIRKVQNDGEYRFSIENIKATQDMIKEIASQVFAKFRIPIEE